MKWNEMESRTVASRNKLKSNSMKSASILDVTDTDTQ